MTVWYYAQESEKHGPITLEKLGMLLENGDVSADALVWHSGMDDWLSAKDVLELKGFIDLPPPLPISKGVNDQLGRTPPPLVKEPHTLSEFAQPVASQSPQASGVDAENLGADQIKSIKFAGPWSRYAARMTDLALLSIVSAAAMELAVPGLMRDLEETELGYRFSFILFVLMGLLLEPLIYKLFGNTPGKAILGIRVESPSGDSLSGLQWLTRNMGVWVYGLGLSVPLVSLFTMTSQYSKVRSTCSTGYDLNRYQVIEKEGYTWHRPTLIVVLIILVLAANIGGLALENYQRYTDKVHGVQSRERQAQAPSVEERVAAQVRAYRDSAQFPVQVDEVTDLVSADSQGKTVIYNYSMTYHSSEVDPDLARQIMKPSLVDSYCTSSSLEFWRSNDVSIRHIYRTSDNDASLIIDIYASDCK